MDRVVIRLCAAADVPAGSVRKCVVPGRSPFAVYNVNGEFFVTEDTCTHGMASLSEGTLDGDVIECPFHAGTFNVRTGEPIERPCVVPLKVFEPTVEDGAVYVNAEPRKSRSAANNRAT